MKLEKFLKQLSENTGSNIPFPLLSDMPNGEYLITYLDGVDYESEEEAYEMTYGEVTSKRYDPDRNYPSDEIGVGRAKNGEGEEFMDGEWEEPNMPEATYAITQKDLDKMTYSEKVPRLNIKKIIKRIKKDRSPDNSY